MAKATVSYSEETKEVKVVVPRGTKSADLGRIVELARTALFPNPRLCSTCFSGRNWQIVEEAPEVTHVDLDQ
jgi:hypothetical protein